MESGGHGALKSSNPARMRIVTKYMTTVERTTLPTAPGVTDMGCLELGYVFASTFAKLAEIRVVFDALTFIVRVQMCQTTCSFNTMKLSAADFWPMRMESTNK